MNCKISPHSVNMSRLVLIQYDKITWVKDTHYSSNKNYVNSYYYFDCEQNYIDRNLQSQDADRLHTCPAIWPFPGRSFLLSPVRCPCRSLTRAPPQHLTQILQFERIWSENLTHIQDYVTLTHNHQVQLENIKILNICKEWE